MPRETPANQQVFQIAAWMWLLYLACQALIDLFIYANQPAGPVVEYHLLNGFPALVFLVLAHLKWGPRAAKILTPALVLLITAAPILIKHGFDLRLPPAPLSNIEGMVLRQLPVLFIGLVLVAWHYDLAVTIAYSLGTNLFELILAFSLNIRDPFYLSAFYFILIIRAVCFLVVGIYINKLIIRLRSQQDSLQAANWQLAHYASTLESLTISRERNRMSRELHDTVVHTLSGLAVHLETTRAYWEVNPDQARALLDQSLATTRAGLQETRRAIKALRASPLDDLGLLQALQELIKNAAQRARLETEVSLPEHEPPLAPDVEQCLYRISQEAVENVVRHANARHLTFRLDSRGPIELWIQDDGTGFNPEASLPGGHFGLAGMHERAQWVGGELTVHSRPNQGTSVHLIISGP